MLFITKSSLTTTKQEESFTIAKSKKVKSVAREPKNDIVEPRLGASAHTKFLADNGFLCPEQKTRRTKVRSKFTNIIKRKQNERSKSRDTTKKLSNTASPIEATTVKSRLCQVISEYQAHSNSQARSEIQSISTDLTLSISKDSSEFQPVSGGQTLSNSQDNSESYLAVDGQGLSSSQDGSESNREDQSNSRDNAESRQLSKDQALSISKDLSESQSLTVDQLPSTSQDPSKSNGQSPSNSHSESQPLLDDQDFSNSLHSSSSQSLSKGQDLSNSLAQSRAQPPLKHENPVKVGIPSERKTISRTRWNHHTAATLVKPIIKHKPLRYQKAGTLFNLKPQLGTIKEEHVVCKVGDRDHDVVAIDDPFDQRVDDDHVDEHIANDNVDQHISNSIENQEHVAEFENKEQREPDDLQISPTLSYPKPDVEDSKVNNVVDESVEEPPLGCVDYGLSISLRSHKILDRILSYEAPCWKWNPLSNSNKEVDHADSDAKHDVSRDEQLNDGIVNDVDKRIDENHVDRHIGVNINNGENEVERQKGEEQKCEPHELSISHSSPRKNQRLEERGIEKWFFDHSYTLFGKTKLQEPVGVQKTQLTQLSKMTVECIEICGNSIECQYEEMSNIPTMCHDGVGYCVAEEEILQDIRHSLSYSLLSLRPRNNLLTTSENIM